MKMATKLEMYSTTYASDTVPWAEIGKYRAHKETIRLQDLLLCPLKKANNKYSSFEKGCQKKACWKRCAGIIVVMGANPIQA